MKIAALFLMASLGLQGAVALALEPPKPLFECRSVNESTQKQIAIIVQSNEVIVFQSSPQTRYLPLHFVTRPGTYRDLSGTPHFSCSQVSPSDNAISINVYDNAVQVDQRSGDVWYAPIQYDIIGTEN